MNRGSAAPEWNACGQGRQARRGQEERVQASVIVFSVNKKPRPAFLLWEWPKCGTTLY
jgi:hypothetical protein